MHFKKYLAYIFYFVLVSFIISCGSQRSSISMSENDATFYLVRHAEKTNAENDPGLSKEGEERAYFLAEYLKNIPLEAIYSTDFFRTRLTAQPISSAKNVPLSLYNPSNLKMLSQEILDKYSKGNILIVGHSNSTPTLVNLIMGNQEFKKLEEWQYDQLYKISISKKGKKRVTRINYGRTSVQP